MNSNAAPPFVMRALEAAALSRTYCRVQRTTHSGFYKGRAFLGLKLLCIGWGRGWLRVQGSQELRFGACMVVMLVSMWEYMALKMLDPEGGILSK